MRSYARGSGFFLSERAKGERGERAWDWSESPPGGGPQGVESLIYSADRREAVAHRNYGKKSYHRNYRLRKVKINSSVPVGALAAGDVVTAAITSSTSDPLRFISVIASYSWSDIAAVIDDGLTFGFAHSDYTAAEIEECLEVAASIDLGDKIAQEQANRLVREIGTISQSGSVAANSGAMYNDGKPVKTRLNWLMSTGDQLGLWVRNASGVVYTTGSDLTVAGDLWVKD